LALNERECDASGKSKLTTTAGESLQSTGPTCGDGTTCEPSRQNQPTNGDATLSAAGSLARTSATPDHGSGLLESEADFGLSFREPFAYFDLASSSWKTYQRCLISEWETFSETWPEAGLMRRGKCYRRAPSVPHIHDGDCSLWPTPTASMDGRGFGIPLHNRTGRYKQSTVRRVQELVGKHGWRIHPNFTEALMGFHLDATAIEESETPSSHKSQNGSEGES
jgi:hypothetical protein